MVGVDWLKEGSDEFVSSFSLSPMKVTFFHCRAGGCTGICDYRPRLCWALANPSHTCQAAAYCLCVLGICLTVEGGLLHFPLTVFSPPYYSPTFSFNFFVLNFIIFLAVPGSSLWRMGSSWL